MVIQFILATAAASTATADPVCASKMIDRPPALALEGVTVPYVRCGKGSPTIVFEGGFAGALQNWASLLPLIGRIAPIFAYSRPGFRGTSGAWEADADGVRTSEEAAKFLRAALRAAKVRPPYVLVGHSLGGLYIQKFAQLYPTVTAGLVLMDNRPATLMKRCATTGIPECSHQSVSPDWSPSLQVTFRGIEPSEATAPTAQQLGEIPVLVITAGKPEEGVSSEFFEQFRKAQTEFAMSLKRGRQATIANATHSSLSGNQAVETAEEIKAFWRGLPGERGAGLRKH